MFKKYWYTYMWASFTKGIGKLILEFNLPQHNLDFILNLQNGMNPQIVVSIIEYNNRPCAQYTTNCFIQANFKGS